MTAAESLRMQALVAAEHEKTERRRLDAAGALFF
jgi:hypothetical protein